MRITTETEGALTRIRNPLETNARDRGRQRGTHSFRRPGRRPLPASPCWGRQAALPGLFRTFVAA